VNFSETFLVKDLKFSTLIIKGNMKLNFSEENLDYLRNIAAEVRYDIIDSTGRAGSGHPGGSLSSVEILTSLYFGIMRHDPRNPNWADRDRFILSKGHAAPALYSVLAHAGYFEREEMKTLRKFASRLQGHPDMRKTPGVEMSTGSLGQGLSLGAGMAAAAELNEKNYNVYVLLGDGECQEGQIWEAAEHSATIGLENLYAIVDHNRLQIDGRTREVAAGKLEKKFSAFGYRTITANGHDFSDIFEAFEKPRKNTPTAIIAYTTKGKGVSFMEDKAEWHGKVAKGDLLEKALKETKTELEKYKIDEIEMKKFIENTWSEGKEVQPHQTPPPTNHTPKKIEYKIGEEVSTRKAFGFYICELSEKYPSIVTLSADLTESTQLINFEKKYGTFSSCKLETEYICGSPKGRHFRCGIREADMAGFAAGLAACGKKPVMTTFDVFYNKMIEQIRQSIAQPKLPVVMVGTHAGLGVEQDGFSHQSSVEPVIMAHMPNIDCWEPCCPSETQEIMDIVIQSNKPSYIRLTRQDVMEIKRNYSVIPGRGVYVVNEEKNPDVVLLGSGAMVYNCLEASKRLEKNGIKSKVLNINNYGEAYSKKHLEEEIPPYIGVVAVQDASPSLLRDIVNRRLSRSPKHNNTVISLGIKGFGESGDKEALYRNYNLDPESIADAAEKSIEDQKYRNKNFSY